MNHPFASAMLQVTYMNHLHQVLHHCPVQTNYKLLCLYMLSFYLLHFYLVQYSTFQFCQSLYQFVEKVQELILLLMTKQIMHIELNYIRKIFRILYLALLNTLVWHFWKKKLFLSVTLFEFISKCNDIFYVLMYQYS